MKDYIVNFCPNKSELEVIWNCENIPIPRVGETIQIKNVYGYRKVVSVCYDYINYIEPKVEYPIMIYVIYE